MLINLSKIGLFRHIYKILPVFNLVVGTSAFAFQLKCLYPWHLQLDDSFTQLDNSFSKLRSQRDKENIEKIDKLNNIENRFTQLDDSFNKLRNQRDKENTENIDKLNNIENRLSKMENNIVRVRSKLSNKL